jgi:hypothetical protein
MQELTNLIARPIASNFVHSREGYEDFSIGGDASNMPDRRSLTVNVLPPRQQLAFVWELMRYVEVLTGIDLGANAKKTPDL